MGTERNGFGTPHLRLGRFLVPVAVSRPFSPHACPTSGSKTLTALSTLLFYFTFSLSLIEFYFCMSHISSIYTPKGALSGHLNISKGNYIFAALFLFDHHSQMQQPPSYAARVTPTLSTRLK
jgi:hypothetical protein